MDLRVDCVTVAILTSSNDFSFSSVMLKLAVCGGKKHGQTEARGFRLIAQNFVLII